MNKVWAFGEHFIHWTCAELSHIARKMNNVCIFSHDQVTHDITLPHIVLNLHLECDMGWYQYTSHSENHCAECENVHVSDKEIDESKEHVHKSMSASSKLNDKFNVF